MSIGVRMFLDTMTVLACCLIVLWACLSFF